MTGLDFIIVGAEKSGTTLLVDLLRRSPDVAIPQQEVRYFRNPFFPDKERPDLYFSDANGRKLRGIKHPSYLGRPEVPQRIKEHSPSAKIIAILRDPIERTLASYLHYVRHGQIPCLSPNVGIPLLFENPDASPKYRDIIEFGDYAKYLQIFLQHFPRNQLLVLEFKEFMRSPDSVNVMFQFLSLTTPGDLWPLPRINEGNYDWGECQRLYGEAKRRFVYDDRANIIGTRDAGNTIYTSSEPQIVELSPHVRNFLAERYKSQSASLERLGLLTPRNWFSN